MNKKILVGLLACAGIIGLLVYLPKSRTRIYGTVRDAYTWAPLKNVFVEESPDGKVTYTNAKGYYILYVSPGLHTVQHSKIGYQTYGFNIELKAGWRYHLVPNLK